MKKERTILIIEDNQNLGELYGFAFEQKGYEVFQANNGLTGITLAVEKKPQVILLDLMMPQMDGFEVLEAIRKNTSLQTSIFVMSNLNEPKNIKKAIQNGAHKFFKKTDHTPQEIVLEVEKELEKN